MRLTLDIPDEAHRRIKTLAAFHGMSMKDFILKRTLEEVAAKNGTHRDPEESDDEEELDATEWIMQRPELVKRLRASMTSTKRHSFNSIEELRHAVGLD